MKKSFFAVLCFAVFLFTGAESFSQDKPSEEGDIIVKDLKEELPPLENLIQIGLKNSPHLKFDDAQISVNKEQIGLVKKDWQNNIGGFANYAFGNQSLGVSNASGNISGNFLNGYRVGVNVSIPLSLFTTRGNQIRMAEAEFQAAEFRKEQTEMELRNRIIMEYYELLAAAQVLEIRSLARENANLQNEMSERNFSEGTLPLEDYTRIARFTTSAQTDFEAAKSAYLIRYKQLEQLLGVSLGVSLENLKGRK